MSRETRKTRIAPSISRQASRMAAASMSSSPAASQVCICERAASFAG